MTIRLLLINPNTTVAMTDRLAAVASRVLPPDTTLTALTAPRGVPYVSSRVEAQVAGGVVLEMLAEHAADHDAVVIAAYGDPGLTAAREMLDIPVVGMAEAAMLTACMLGTRFAVVTFAARLLPWFAEGVAASGLSPRCAGFFTPREGFGSVTTVAEELREPLVALCHDAAAAGADVAILAGAPIAGLAEDIAAAVPIVTLDPVSAAVLQAAALARLAPRGASAGSFARPPAKQSTGLDPNLARWIANAG
jgi:Asp/Glu/hydantoin racemase